MNVHELSENNSKILETKKKFMSASRLKQSFSEKSSLLAGRMHHEIQWIMKTGAIESDKKMKLHECK